nr:MlaD family protein [Nocardia bovistercoris]
MLAVAILYVIPLGDRTYTADLTEAQSVRVGDDVRLAGISVGRVEGLDLHPDKVRMRFSVRDDVFLGAQTSLDIRMLTVVGGHYVAIVPAGAEPLGDRAIPADRVRLPYSLMQTFQDAERPVREIDGDTVRRNLAALATSLEQSPDGLRQILNGVEQFVDVLDRQRSDVSKAIAFADEYLNSIDAARGALRKLVDKVNLLENLLIDHRAELREAVSALRRVVNRVAALQPAWEGTLEPMARQLSAAAAELLALGDRLEPLLGQVRELGTTLRAMMLPDGTVEVDHSGATVDAPPGADPLAMSAPVCVPVPGRGC